MSKEALTASRMACWTLCQRKHLYAYDRGVRSIETGDALVFGTAWHKAQEVYYNTRGIASESPDFTPEENKSYVAQDMFEAALATAENWNEFTVAKLSACIAAFVECYYGRDIIANMKPEVEFSYPIEGTRTFEARGKIDGLATLADGRTALVEHKTTSESVEADSPYWTRLRFNPQLCRYVLGARAMGIECETVIYDVFRKPQISPRDAVKDIDADGMPIVLDADGNRAFKRDGQPKKTADAAKGETYKTHAETPDEYCERLKADIESRPEFYFARREVTVTDAQLEAFMLQERMMAKQIVDARTSGRDAVKRGLAYDSAFMMNVGKMTCDNCDYAPFCLTGQTIDPENPPQGFAVVGATPELEGGK